MSQFSLKDVRPVETIIAIASNETCLRLLLHMMQYRPIKMNFKHSYARLLSDIENAVCS